MTTKKNHAERAHSKFSASGAERWFECSASVELSEGQPDKASPWALEGTQAHEVLETIMQNRLKGMSTTFPPEHMRKRGDGPHITNEMIAHANNAANFIFGIAARSGVTEVLSEVRVYLKFIHEEMFGTFDGAVLDHWGTLHVFDYKYGAGKGVSPKGNLQMIFYAIGLAQMYQWNFKNVRLWIIQPRIKGYDGPTFWDLSMTELRAYVPQFKEAVDKVLNDPDLNEGDWCHWCKAKSICPVKRAAKLDQARLLFSPTGSVNRGKEESRKKESYKEEFKAIIAARQKDGEEKGRKEESREAQKLEAARQVFRRSERRTATAGDDADFY